MTLYDKQRLLCYFICTLSVVQCFQIRFAMNPEMVPFNQFHIQAIKYEFWCAKIMKKYYMRLINKNLPLL
jgi:hypothetical protein